MKKTLFAFTLAALTILPALPSGASKASEYARWRGVTLSIARKLATDDATLVSNLKKNNAAGARGALRLIETDAGLVLGQDNSPDRTLNTDMDTWSMSLTGFVATAVDLLNRQATTKEYVTARKLVSDAEAVLGRRLSFDNSRWLGN
jgi:hypothetical protein